MRIQVLEPAWRHDGLPHDEPSASVMGWQRRQRIATPELLRTMVVQTTIPRPAGCPTSDGLVLDRPIQDAGIKSSKPEA